MNRFSPPGFVTDLTDEQQNQWSDIVSSWLDQAQAGNPADNDGPRPQFFNALKNPPAADQTIKVISWNAFPRQVKSSSLSDKQRWRRADGDRNLQDEYCEWSVERNPITRKITRVTFTCEGPEYWEVLAQLNPEKILELYQEFVSPTIQRNDLFTNGKYNRFNRFNNSTTNGAMHLIQSANSLGAEIELGAAATLRRMHGGKELTDAQELISCSQYGEAGRNSDPFIGEQVNALARLKHDITINNPVGLYFHEFNPVGWITPDNANPLDFWTYIRGRDGYFVRAVFEVPADRGYVVGDIQIGGRPLEFGAQIADFITIKLEGLATRLGQSTVTPVQGCRGAAAPPAIVPANALHFNQFPSLSRLDTGTAKSTPTALADSGLAVSIDDLSEQELFDFLPEALRPDAAAPPAPKLPYPPLPDEAFVPRMVSGKIMAYASPDSTYAITKKLLESAQQSIIIGIYDFHADYIKNLLKQAMRRGVRVSLMLETNSDDELTIFDELSQLGAVCVKAPAVKSGNPLVYFDNAHEKIIVIDEEIVMIQSGNWSENSIPFNEGDGVVVGHFTPGNRDMGVAIESRELATFFANLVARDMRLAQGLPVGAAPASILATSSAASSLFFEAAPSAVPRLFHSLTVTPSTPVRITPVVSPENFFSITRDFLRSAKKSIRIEQQYIRGQQDVVRTFLKQIQAARVDNPALDIRIIVSPKYLSANDKAVFVKAMTDFGFDFDDNYRYLSSKHFVHCHNKLIVVDEEKVLVGSQNWSTTGITTNREASLLVEHAGITAYFAQIFDADWRLSEPTEAPANDFINAVSSSTFTEGGIVESTARDYWDV